MLAAHVACGMDRLGWQGLLPIYYGWQILGSVKFEGENNRAAYFYDYAHGHTAKGCCCCRPEACGALKRQREHQCHAALLLPNGLLSPLDQMMARPVWLDHITVRSDVFDGDNVFLAGQDRNLAQRAQQEGASWRE